MNIAIQTLNQTAKATKAAGDLAGGLMEATSECVPKNTIAGVAAGGDIFSVARCGIKSVGIAVNSVTNVIGEGLELAANGVAAGQDDVGQLAALEVQTLDSRFELYGLKGQFDELLRREPLLRMEMFSRIEAIEQLYRSYLEELARGQRLMAELVQFRKTGAAATQEYRYQDMAFRIFRNDALQKYRAAFDMAARYVYLAAAAYDYETNLLGSDSQAGQTFLTDIVRERSLGQILDGEPVASSSGLADPMGRMSQNFEVLKGQLGFNNPQVETNRFSLRRELYRLRDDEEGDEAWRQVLSGGQGQQSVGLARVSSIRPAAAAGIRWPIARPGIPFSDHGQFWTEFLPLAVGAGRQHLRSDPVCHQGTFQSEPGSVIMLNCR